MPFISDFSLKGIVRKIASIPPLFVLGRVDTRMWAGTKQLENCKNEAIHFEQQRVQQVFITYWKIVTLLRLKKVGKR